jgi:type IV secretion system protein TrbF
MRFKRSQQRYGRTPEPNTPYARAGQVWDERIGSARAQARNWRLMAFLMVGLTTSVSGALIWQSTQSQVRPYVVEVDRLGEPRAVAPAMADFQPTDPQIAWHLSKFIRNVRGRSLDPVLMRENWLEAYDLVGPRAAIFLGDYARSADPFAEIGAKSVSVQVTSVVRASERSFQVKWDESLYERGSLAGRSRWTAILTVSVKPPRSMEALRKNPLGLIIEAIDWSRELEPTATTPPTPPDPQVTPPPTPTQDPNPVPSGSPLDPGLGRHISLPSPRIHP